MLPELKKPIDGYLKKHPEIQQLLDIFNVSQEEYENALKALGAREDNKSEYSLTAQEDYNVNVSSAT